MATRRQGGALDRLTIHDLRHTAASLWIATGANMKAVSARAGHTSVSFTLDRYGHLYGDADEQLTSRLESVYVATGDTVRPAAPTEAVTGIAAGGRTRQRHAAGEVDREAVRAASEAMLLGKIASGSTTLDASALEGVSPALRRALEEAQDAGSEA
ncbi:MAG: tyrosine-type recombinase/integrase [Nocardioides sp.]